MKFIDDRIIPIDPFEFVAHLNANGVIAEHSSERSSNLHGHLNRSGVWVKYNHQYKDAFAFLSNPEHVVENPIDPSEVYAMEAMAKQELFNRSEKFFSILAQIVFYVSLVALAYYFVRNYLEHT